jgi:hypothetical protein
MKLDPADRKILLAAFAILSFALLVAIIAGPSPEESLQYPSPYSTAAGGAKAAYELLPQLGYREDHWRHSPARLREEAGTKTVLIIDVPTQNPTPDDREEIRKYLLAGGKVLAIGGSSTYLLPHYAASGDIPHFAWQTYRSLLPSHITDHAPEIALAPSAAYWDPQDFNSQVQYGDEKHGVVASYKYGQGEVIWWAAADPLTNSGLLQKQNLQMFLNTLGPASQRVVLWDDYFHGGELTLYDSLLASPLKWALLQVALLALVIVLTHSRRNGPIRGFPQRPRLASLEFVETLGSLYAHARASDVAVEVAYQRFRHLLSRKFGISPSVSTQQLLARLQGRLGTLEPEFHRTIDSCEVAMRQTDLPNTEALRLVQVLNQYSEQLKLKNAVSPAMSSPGQTLR